ncbi:unnamed protein product [Cercopithifilaria johnstoni]|uniref:Uncharacterized protein n=1 Tax=Cercopithifilaria johnstoni TaxID=2874296 RepID=A0A8J2Q6Y5_9BILA|nr:unnamed protein product [Cercopithifilaria johnstoni]
MLRQLWQLLSDASCSSCNQEKGAYMIGFSHSNTEIGINLELGTAVSTETKVALNSKTLEILPPAEVEAKSNLSLMLKEEEQGEVLALPSPGTLNDMMSKVQSKLKF